MNTELSKLPFVVESETDLTDHPTEGVVGTEVSIVARDCTECGYDRAKVAYAVLPGVHHVSCMACGHTLEQG